MNPIDLLNILWIGIFLECFHTPFNIPSYNDLSSSVPAALNDDTSQETSLQLSTSQEQPPPPRALTVQKNVKTPSSSSSSSSSSRASLPPSGRSSHRGAGSVPDVPARLNQAKMQLNEIDLQLDQHDHYSLHLHRIEQHDQRSTHHHQHFTGQRTQQQFNVVQVGISPEQVVQSLQSTETQAAQVIESQAREHVQARV